MNGLFKLISFPSRGAAAFGAYSERKGGIVMRESQAQKSPTDEIGLFALTRTGAGTLKLFAFR